jgi:hypothetical protein
VSGLPATGGQIAARGSVELDADLDAASRSLANVETTLLGNGQNGSQPSAKVFEEMAISSAPTTPYLMLLLVAGYGIHYVRVNRQLPGKATITVIKDLWSRFASRHGKSTLGRSAPVAEGDLPVTRVIDYIP